MGGAGTVCHMGGRVDFTLCSQCKALGAEGEQDSSTTPSFPRRRAVHRDEKDKVVTPLG